MDDDKSVKDALGRVLELRKINVADQVKLLRAIGPAQSTNQPYVSIVTMAATVSAIDGVPMIMPRDERTIDAAIAKIGDEGFLALSVSMSRQIKAMEDAAEAAADGEVATASDPLVKSA